MRHAEIAAWLSAEFRLFTPPLELEIMLGPIPGFLRRLERNCMAKQTTIAAVILLFWGTALGAQQPAARPAPLATQQTESDEYTRYELLAPETASFKIHYEVTATTPGARVYFNPIRKGSTASNEDVYDAMTGEPLRFEIVSGAEARKDPLMSVADSSGSYIKVQLARPVPPEGQGRIVIVKTYQDPKSYYREGDTIVFNRGLGIKRNSVVLPKGFELVGCNMPSQILSELDGRIAISFMNAGPGEAPLILRARPDAQTGPSAAPIHSRKRVVGKRLSLEKPSASGSPNGRIRTDISSISSNNQSRTRSTCIMTTRSHGRVSTNISTSFARAAPFPILPRISWTPAKSFPPD